MLGKIIKFSLFGLIGWALIGNARPAYMEAWKVKKAADLAAVKSSDSSSRRDVESAFRRELEVQGCKTAMESLLIDTSKENGQWIVSGEFSVLRPVFGTVSVNYDFSVASNRKTLWQ